MALDAAQHILQQVRQLSRDEQLDLVAQIQHGLARPVSASPPRSILELQGLGKEAWGALDVQTYLRHERESWNR